MRVNPVSQPVYECQTSSGTCIRVKNFHHRLYQSVCVSLLLCLLILALTSATIYYHSVSAWVQSLHCILIVLLCECHTRIASDLGTFPSDFPLTPQAPTLSSDLGTHGRHRPWCHHPWHPDLQAVSGPMVALIIKTLTPSPWEGAAAAVVWAVPQWGRSLGHTHTLCQWPKWPSLPCARWAVEGILVQLNGHREWQGGGGRSGKNRVQQNLSRDWDFRQGG